MANYSVNDISRYRLVRAAEMLVASRRDLQEKDYASANNRAYYCFLHAMRAVLILDGVDEEEAEDIIGSFTGAYLLTEILPREYVSLVTNASLLRHRSDYEDFYTCTADETRDVINDASRFLTDILAYLQTRYTDERKLKKAEKAEKTAGEKKTEKPVKAEPAKKAEKPVKAAPAKKAEKPAKDAPAKEAEKPVKAAPVKKAEKTAKAAPSKKAEKPAKAAPAKDAEKAAKAAPAKDAEKAAKAAPSKKAEKPAKAAKAAPAKKAEKPVKAAAEKPASAPEAEKAPAAKKAAPAKKADKTAK